MSDPRLCQAMESASFTNDPPSPSLVDDVIDFGVVPRVSSSVRVRLVSSVGYFGVISI